MEFLKDLLKLQHKQTLKQVSEIVFQRDFEKKTFCEMYNKHNYCCVHVCQCSMNHRVQIDKLLSSLQRDHNPSILSDKS